MSSVGSSFHPDPTSEWSGTLFFALLLLTALVVVSPPELSEETKFHRLRDLNSRNLHSRFRGLVDLRMGPSDRLPANLKKNNDS